MPDQRQINKSVVRLIKDDITNLDIQCFVYYARSDLKLGSGHGGAIAVRGGPSVQEELNKIGPIGPGLAVISKGGALKAKHIIHANGPKFQEVDIENKLRTTVANVMKLADEKGIANIAFPAMGVGFYGVPLDVSAKISLETVKGHLEGQTAIKEVVFCMIDNREYIPFQAQLQALR